MRYLKKIWHNFSNVFGATIFHPQFFSYRYLISDMKNGANYAAGTLVDIGCGAKPYKKYLISKVQHYFGFDYPSSSEEMIIPQPPEVYANALNIPVRDGSVNTVVLTQVLEHVSDPDCTIKEVSRVLKQGGILIMSLPMLYPIHSAPYDFFRFTQYGIKEILGRNGFDTLSMSTHGGFTAAMALLTNVFLMHKLFNLAKEKQTVLIAMLLAPIVFLLTTAINLIAYILQPFDKERRFTSNYFVIAKKI